MESALRPRDIQARVRAGESLEEVAVAAGVPIDRIEPYAIPVLAERAHIAEMAQAAPVRRRGEMTTTRTLRLAVLERLASRGVDLADVKWDAWRIEGRLWHIQADYRSGSADRSAGFTFDVQGRFSVAADEDAQWLIGDESTAHGPQPGKKRRVENPDTEPTLDLDDELALVRAVNVERLSDDIVETEDAYSPGDLTEVDGVYDIVPPTSDLDVLYDMLSTFNEDSVQIYRGLTTPVVADEALADEAAAAESAPESEVSPGPEESPEHEAIAAPEVATETETAPGSEAATTTGRRRRKRAKPKPIMDQPTLASSEIGTQGAAAAQPLPAAGPAESAESPAQAEPATEQTEPAAQTPPATADDPEPAKRRRRRKRASVPSWDEIMFGSPTTPKPPTQQP